MPKVERVCELCGESFWVYPSSIKWFPSKFCSLACAGKARRNKISRTCERCGKQFIAERWIVKSGGARFCGWACANQGRVKKPLEQRFWKHVLKSDGPDDCWLWTGAASPKGYGEINVAGKPRLSHVIAWELEHGPTPPDIEIHHTCHTPACVRESHLVALTHLEHTTATMEQGSIVHGSQHWNAKLNESQAREIRRLNPIDKTMRCEVAALFGVHPGTIADIVARRSWKHI
jgi:hypothetical protein